jgi:hypothetical protein
MKQEIIIEETKCTPAVYFEQEKKLLVISGRSIPENPEKIYSKIQDWIDNHFIGNESLNIEIRFDYLNSGSSKYLFYIIKHLSALRKKNKTINIVWFYEEDDESMQELGEYITSTFDIPVTLEVF